MNKAAKKKINTQYVLLSRLRFENLPKPFSNPLDIGDLQALHAAKMVECKFPAAGWVRGVLHYQGAAVVERLTAPGRTEAERFSVLARHGRKPKDQVKT